MRFALLIALLFAGCVAGDSPAGSREERARLFAEIVTKTIDREAFSAIKDERMGGGDFASRAPALKDAFLEAESEADLLRAVTRLSNLRRDGHMGVHPVEDGMQYPPEPWRRAPIRFAVDYGAHDAPVFFVADSDAAISSRILEVSPAGTLPASGDLLLEVNGVPVKEMLARMEPYLPCATRERLWLEFAVNVSAKRPDFDPSFYEDDVTYALQPRDGPSFTIRLPYLPPEEVVWTGRTTRRIHQRPPWEETMEFTWAGWATEGPYSGFREDHATDSYVLHLPEDRSHRVVLLEWRDVKESLVVDLRRLMDEAAVGGYLGHDAIIDFTRSHGGQRGWLVVQALSSRPFRITGANLRLSGITEDFIVRRLEEIRRADDPMSDRLRDWLSGVVKRDRDAGRPYTAPIPFKLALPAESDGIMQPAPRHFTGRLVFLFGPLGRSQIDQIAAMVVDNGLGHTIGMPTAGTSNSWEYSEVLNLGATGRPVARFEWAIGHTLRPNGEVLEGNPAPVAELVPLTRDNYATYQDELVSRALKHLGHQR